MGLSGSGKKNRNVAFKKIKSIKDVLLDSTGLYINEALKLIEIKLNAASFSPELSKDEETAIGCHEHFEPDNRARRINYIWMTAENIAPFLSKNNCRPDGEQKSDISN